MKKSGSHDFSGSCAPGKVAHYVTSTFSVGIFQWVPKASGKGLKKSAVIFRISGPSSVPEVVYRKARQICAEMDAGKYPKTKSMTI